MKFEEFKEELLYNARYLREAEGKRLIIVEKGMLAEGSGVEHMTAYLNLYCRGMEKGPVQEDILLASWHRDGRPDWRCWQIRECFERFQAGGWPGILPEIAERLKNNREEGRGSFFTGGYEACRPELIVQPLSQKRCEKSLNNGIFWKRGEIILALYGVLRAADNELMTVRITREMSARWEVRDDALLAQALFWTEALLPLRLYGVQQREGSGDLWEAPVMYGIRGLWGGRETKAGRLLKLPDRYNASCVAEDGMDSGQGGLRLTNSSGISGAAAMFYPGVKERLSKLLGGDYYAAFPSVHEARVYPVCHEAVRRLMAEVQEGRCRYEKEELLTDSIYRYSSDRQELIEV